MIKGLRRKFTTSTFIVEGQLCKIFFEPKNEFQKGFWFWNVGFAVGRSNRQINDWYWKRKNRRARSLNNKIIGKSGVKIIKKGFETVLDLRWILHPGDCYRIDCTSGEPEKQFRAYKYWHRNHPDILVDKERREFIWHRPPYANDPIWRTHKIIGFTPSNTRMSMEGQRYSSCFQAFELNEYLQA